MSSSLRPPSPFVPAWWARGPHAQTLWGKLARRVRPLPTRTERWDTPDGDFLDVVRLPADPARFDPARAPRLLLLHGLEGGVQSHYALGMFGEAERRGWAMDLMLHRSCGAELNRQRRFYHSGETTDVALVVQRIGDAFPDAPLAIAGVSLGGNQLVKFLGERGAEVPPNVRRAAAISVPYDLARGSRHISHGFSRVYERHFLRSLVRKVEAKRSVYPDLIAAERLPQVRTLYEFDDVFTGPVHGFTGADDYYTRSSALHFLAGVRVPTLLLSAVDDPFLPAAVLDQVRAVAAENPALSVEFPAHGGHVGFVGGTLPWRPDYYAERRTFEFVADMLRPPRDARAA
jgi:predicted alpha/beta-fold hydrolase